MSKMLRMALMATVLFSGIAVAQEPAPAPAPLPPVKCLLVGMGPHADSIMGEPLQDIKAKYPTVDITATENIEDLHYDNLKNYQVLALVKVPVENGNPPDFFKEDVVRFLKEGGGLVVTHFAVANMQEWSDSIDILGAMWVNGKSTHDAYHEFSLDMVDEGHPIVEGVKPFTTTDELYFNLLMRPDMHIIMTADQERFGHTVPEPMLCTHYVYNARCVYFALGHDAASVKVPEYKQILVQSIEWAACRR